MRAFDHISGTIDRIYKDLTVSRTHPMGGAAYLSLESEEEPFLHGIKFTAMPPTKRFRDMEQLSGGEKTVAALALLFSIHRCAQAPAEVLLPFSGKQRESGEGVGSPRRLVGLAA